MVDQKVLTSLMDIISKRILVKKKLNEEYDFLEIKRMVLNENKSELGNKRDEYSSEISRIYAIGRNKKRKGKKLKPRKSRKTKEEKTVMQSLVEKSIIQQAQQWELSELIRSGEIDPPDHSPTQPIGMTPEG